MAHGDPAIDRQPAYEDSPDAMAIEVRIAQWHAGFWPPYIQMHEALGWTRDEFSLWVFTDEVPLRTLPPLPDPTPIANPTPQETETC